MDMQLIERFLSDVRDYFKASLETSEYENTSNLFHMTEAEATVRLLQRCEQLLAQCSPKNANVQHQNGLNGLLGRNGVNGLAHIDKLAATIITTKAAMSNGIKPTATIEQVDGDASYLDMTACSKKNVAANDHNAMNASTDSDKTFRCSTRIGDISTAQKTSANVTDEEAEHSNADYMSEDTFDEDGDSEARIYDICHVTQFNKPESQKPIIADAEFVSTSDCPYLELPAGHLSIQKSNKYGQLQRIEKRLFFDQSKKCYCGILNDWLLCYADGPTACKPSLTLHLKGPSTEIEHSGEGKRRELCFQITTADPNKKFIFQAISEVDAKEWIHAIEAAIRGDTLIKHARKLPSPPTKQKQLTFVGNNHEDIKASANSLCDYIYEEPCPLYQMHEPTELLIAKHTSGEPPDLSAKLDTPNTVARKFEYDVPKCPPQPLQTYSDQVEPETMDLLNVTPTAETCPIVGISVCTPSPQKSNHNSSSADKLNFQNKVKDVHSKLSSQLTSGPKAVKKTYSCSSTESDGTALTTLATPTSKELKKQKKSTAPQTSPQKQMNNNNNNNNNHSNTNTSTNNNNTNSCSDKSANTGSNNITTSSGSEKSAKNWFFLNRLNKTTSSVRSSASTSPAKCKQSEKENLLNSLEICDGYEGADLQYQNNSSNPTSPILKTSSSATGGSSGCGGGKSKVNMIINQFETSGHLSMFNVEALAANAMASFSSFCNDNDCNNYEPIMAISTPPSSFMKKV